MNSTLCINADFEHANFSSTDLAGANFTNCDVYGAILDTGKINEFNFWDAEGVPRSFLNAYIKALEASLEVDENH
jgi:uncharacterized protein YjbI with pentapeptide repeats